jgi:aldehyde dehydrogenase (NAD+)
MTKDISTAMSMARGLQYGMVHVNGSTIQCEPNIPFGGLKSSGVGREGGRFSIDEMTELKWVTIQEGQSSYPF